jgi:hypothetical protein
LGIGPHAITALTNRWQSLAVLSPNQHARLDKLLPVFAFGSTAAKLPPSTTLGQSVKTDLDLQVTVVVDDYLTNAFMINDSTINPHQIIVDALHTYIHTYIHTHTAIGVEAHRGYYQALNKTLLENNIIGIISYDETMVGGKGVQSSMKTREPHDYFTWEGMQPTIPQATFHIHTHLI